MCIAIFLLGVWTNRYQLPARTKQWNHMRNILVLSLGYLLIFQIQFICSYPMSISDIFMYTLWIIPVVYASAIWMFYRQTKNSEAETYCLSNMRATLLFYAAVLLIIGVVVEIILCVLWYNDATIWYDRWHTRIPAIITAVSEILLVLFLIIKNK